jgi:hypothetical protein
LTVGKAERGVLLVRPRGPDSGKRSERTEVGERVVPSASV